jgi:hypothetical protein
MNVFRLVYCSRAVGSYDRAALTDLLKVAKSRNDRDGLTGVLCYSAHYFFQCLEGPRTAVSRTLGRIYRDPRHTDVTLVDARCVSARAFPNWAMELVGPERLPAGLVEKMFDPQAAVYTTARLDAERLLNFLEEVSPMPPAGPQAVRPVSPRAGSGLLPVPPPRFGTDRR